MYSFRKAVRDLVLSWADVPSPRTRSIRLLKQNLSPAQLAQYKRLDHFEVIGGASGSRYRIRHGDVMNVELLDKNGRRACLLCFMPEGKLPIGDVMLAQKVALELFEAEAISIANKMAMTSNAGGRW
jgi:hypothetical protein